VKFAILTLAFAIAVIRPVLLFHDFGPHFDRSYQAFAHGLVFSMLAVGYVYRDMAARLAWLTPEAVDWCWGQSRWLITFGWLLTLDEVACFALDKLGVFA
jgi:hypothetical protein